MGSVKRNTERQMARKFSRDMNMKYSFLLGEEDYTSLPCTEDFAQGNEALLDQVDGSTGSSTGSSEESLPQPDDDENPGLNGNGIDTSLCWDTEMPIDETSKVLEDVAQALHYRLKSFFDEGILYFIGGFAIRGSRRGNTDVDLEVSEPSYLTLLRTKIESCGFKINKITERGFNAVDKATGVRVSVRTRLFKGIEPFSMKCGGYNVACDDVQLIQKLNALPNRRGITKQNTDIMDIQFLLGRGALVREELVGVFDQKTLLEAIGNGRIDLQDGRISTLIEGLGERGLIEMVNYVNKEINLA
ncbi:hypothetical protein TWF730_009237 [Orbilia blumenaviensis]|uniref:Nucleotidyltransferase n=1 Tax=Orbilia blumenaviensis TaxID=1796055 RepID=A0AAV9UYL4_9PEZI